MNDKKTPEFWAEWLVDAVAGATQDRRFLRGDKAEDKIVTEALYANALKGMRNLISHQFITIPPLTKDQEEYLRRIQEQTGKYDPHTMVGGPNKKSNRPK